MVMVMIVIVVMMVMESRIRQDRAGHRMSQLALEPPLDAGILLRRLDLFDIERDAESLRKIAFCNGPVASLCGARIEVLVEPEIRRRDDRAGFPVDLYRIVGLFETLPPRERESFAIE